MFTTSTQPDFLPRRRQESLQGTDPLHPRARLLGAIWPAGEMNEDHLHRVVIINFVVVDVIVVVVNTVIIVTFSGLQMDHPVGTTGQVFGET